MGKTALASAWAMARRRPKEYRRKVDAAPANAPTPDLTCSGKAEGCKEIEEKLKDLN